MTKWKVEVTPTEFHVLREDGSTVVYGLPVLAYAELIVQEHNRAEAAEQRVVELEADRNALAFGVAALEKTVKWLWGSIHVNVKDSGRVVRAEDRATVINASLAELREKACTVLVYLYLGKPVPTEAIEALMQLADCGAETNTGETDRLALEIRDRTP